MFIGYAEGSKAYRILDPETACAHGVRRCVRRRAWDKAVDDSSAPTYDDFAERAYPSP